MRDSKVVIITVECRIIKSYQDCVKFKFDTRNIIIEHRFRNINQLENPIRYNVFYRTKPIYEIRQWKGQLSEQNKPLVGNNGEWKVMVNLRKYVSYFSIPRRIKCVTANFIDNYLLT